MGKAFICIYGAIYAVSDGDGRIGACSFCDPVEEDDAEEEVDDVKIGVDVYLDGIKDQEQQQGAGAFFQHSIYIHR